jgi:hypothetical protein
MRASPLFSQSHSSGAGVELPKARRSDELTTYVSKPLNLSLLPSPRSIKEQLVLGFKPNEGLNPAAPHYCSSSPRCHSLPIIARNLRSMAAGGRRSCCIVVWIKPIVEHCESSLRAVSRNGVATAFDRDELHVAIHARLKLLHRALRPSAKNSIWRQIRHHFATRRLGVRC